MENLGEKLLRYDEKQKYLIWDVESCSLNLGLPNNKVWQLSFIICNKNKILDEYNFFPWWENIQVSRDAARITRFNFENYKRNSSDPAESLKKFESFLYDPEFLSVGHNHYNFDFYLHNLYRKNLGLNSDYSYIYNGSGAIDTNAVARAIKTNVKIPENKMSRISMMWKLSSLRQKGLKTSILQLLKDENIPYDENELHDGIVDCRKNYEIFKRQLFQVEI